MFAAAAAKLLPKRRKGRRGKAEISKARDIRLLSCHSQNSRILRLQAEHLDEMQMSVWFGRVGIWLDALLPIL
jgi:hypothetical protein